MSCEPVVIGASCDDQINYGETIELVFTYQDENGDPIDLSDATPSILSSTPSVIKTAGTFTVTDAANGEATFLLSRDDATGLRRGRNNHFQLQMIFGPNSDDTTPEIYLQVT